MLKKADIAINTIFIMVITMISIVLLLSLFWTQFPKMGDKLYCKTFFHIQSSVFIPESARVAKSVCDNQLFGVNNIIQKARTHKDFELNGTKRTLRFEGSPGTANINIPNARIISANFSARSSNPTTLLTRFNTQLISTTLQSNTPFTQDFTSILNNVISSCTTDFCNITISFEFTSGSIIIYDLNIVYEDCFVLENLVAAALSCWQKSDYGKHNKDLICDELVLGESCQTNKLITDDQVTDFLLQNNLCEALPNNPPVCGYGQDRLEWQLPNLITTRNILVEYVLSSKMIKVS